MLNFKRIFCLALSLTTLTTLAACKEKGDTASKPSSSKSASQSKEVVSKSDEKTESVYYSTDIWQQVPLVTQAALDMGFKGGEGCQWMTFITFDPIDGSTAYAGVDVGGMLKSTDGGKTWNQSTVGLRSSGATGIAVDPKNIDRVIAIGCDSSKKDQNGLYLSTDQGATWSGKKNLPVKGNRDFRRQVAFDVSSYDQAKKACMTVYWVTENFGDNRAGLYKSTDAGETWKKMDGSDGYAGSCIAVHPTTGAVYLTTGKGLLKSTDGGKSFSATSVTASSTYLCTVSTEPDNIYITANDGFYVYNTSSGKATKLCATGVNSYPRDATYISVSPANTKKMVLQSDALSASGTYGSNINFYSEDGGRSWAQSKSDYTGSFIPRNARQNPSSFHPTDENLVIKLGGDFIMRSEDGGKNWKMSNDGNNAMCIGGKFNFNVNDPNLISVSSQDYNGGFSIDGGKTWTYLNWSGSSWGGMTYGAYMINKTTAVAGLTTEWYSKTKEVEIALTFDGGKTFTKTGIVTKGATVGIGALGNDNIVCFADHRSTDGGKTWTKMNGCTGVFTIDYKTGTMYGANDLFVVMSQDNGATWTQITTVGSNPEDMAYNSNTGTLYVAAGGSLYRINPSDKKMDNAAYGSSGIKSICVDPQNNDIMYAGCRDYTNASNDSVMRTVDGGKTWVCLNRSAGDGRTGPDGARCTSFVRVAGDGSVWCVAGCRGIWKMARPDLSEKK